MTKDIYNSAFLAGYEAGTRKIASNCRKVAAVLRGDRTATKPPGKPQGKPVGTTLAPIPQAKGRGVPSNLYGRGSGVPSNLYGRDGISGSPQASARPARPPILHSMPQTTASPAAPPPSRGSLSSQAEQYARPKASPAAPAPPANRPFDRSGSAQRIAEAAAPAPPSRRSSLPPIGGSAPAQVSLPPIGGSVMNSLPGRPPSGGAPTASPAAPAPDLTSEFKKYHGTSFDPNSEMDRGKLEKMKQLYAQHGKLSPSIVYG